MSEFIEEEKKEEMQENSWDCKFCTMTNNKYIPYCEICLIPRDIQKNKHTLKNLRNTLKSNEDKFINAQKIRDTAKLVADFENDLQRLKNCHQNKNVIYDIQQEIQTFYVKYICFLL